MKHVIFCFVENSNDIFFQRTINVTEDVPSNIAIETIILLCIRKYLNT